MKLGSLPSGLLVVENSFSTESLMEKFSVRQNKAELLWFESRQQTLSAQHRPFPWEPCLKSPDLGNNTSWPDATRKLSSVHSSIKQIKFFSHFN